MSKKIKKWQGRLTGREAFISCYIVDRSKVSDTREKLLDIMKKKYSRISRGKLGYSVIGVYGRVGLNVTIWTPRLRVWDIKKRI